MKKRKIYPIILAAVSILLAALLCASAVSVYLEGSARRAENPLENIYTREIAAEKLTLIAPVFLLLIILLFAGLLPGLRKEKKKTGHTGTGSEAPAVRNGEEKKKKVLQTVVVVTAVILIIAGILNGSAYDVLIKAITICSECIGLG